MGLFSWLTGGSRSRENRAWNQNLTSEFEANRQRQSEHYANVNSSLLQERQRQEAMMRDLEARFKSQLDDPSSSPWASIYENGGLDEGDVSHVRSIADEARNWARNPISAADKNKLFADGTYDEFNKTGGWSPEAAMDFRARSNSAIPSFYAGLKEELDTKNRASGGWNPGYTSGVSKMAREGARAARDAATDTEMQLGNSVREGRRWGAQGLTNAEQILQQIIANAKSSGLGMAGNLESNILNQRQQGRLSGASGLSNDRNTALSGLSGLYTNSPAWYQLLGMSGDAVNSAGNSGLNYSNSGLGNNPVGASPLQAITGLGGAAAGIMTGIQGFNAPKSVGPVSNIPLSNTQGYASYNPAARKVVR